MRYADCAQEQFPRCVILPALRRPAEHRAVARVARRRDAGGAPPAAHRQRHRGAARGLAPHVARHGGRRGAGRAAPGAESRTRGPVHLRQQGRPGRADRASARHGAHHRRVRIPQVRCASAGSESMPYSKLCKHEKAEPHAQARRRPAHGAQRAAGVRREFPLHARRRWQHGLSAAPRIRARPRCALYTARRARDELLHGCRAPPRLLRRRRLHRRVRCAPASVPLAACRYLWIGGWRRFLT